MMEQKIVTNQSLQALEVYFMTPLGLKCYWMQPKDVKVVPANFISNSIVKLQRRKMLSVANYR